jgi:hypothetical protein
MEYRSKMKAKELIKDVMGELPFTVDIYWLLRQRYRKFNSRFNLDDLTAFLPGLIAQTKAFAEKAPQGKKVFFFASGHYWITQGALCGLALRALGHEVTLCYLPYSHFDKPLSRFEVRRHDLYTRQVLKDIQPLLKIISMLDIRQSGTLPLELTSAIEKLTLIDAQYIRQREDIAFDDPMYLLRKERNLEAGRRLMTWFQKNRPDVVIVPNGMILEYGSAYETARCLGLPTVTYEFSEQEQRVWLSQDRPVMYFDGFTDLWKIYQDRQLSVEQRDWLDDFLGARQRPSKGEEFAHLWQKASREGGERTRALLGLDARPIVLLPTNVLGDTATLGRAVFSESMSDWIQKVVPFFANKPNIQLLVRIHPAESRTVGPSIADIIRKVLPDLPAHIHLIGPKEKVNTYDLMDIADLALVYTTTAGMEMALRGIPVMVSGLAPYRNRGFTIDTNSWDEYFQKLGEMLADLPAHRLTEAQTRRAWNYAYAFFRDFTRPFPWHLEHMKKALQQRPFSYVLSPEGQREFEITFKELTGTPIKW